MTDDERQALSHIAREWCAARDVIAEVLREHDVEAGKAIAVQILARLASHEPPILLEASK